jgi:phenylacetate-CoA ligase
VILEVLDAAGRPCAPGETGEVVLTALQNFRSPLIRYQLLDDVTRAAGPCPCGRGLPLLTRIDGKRRPMMNLPNGRFKSSTDLAVLLTKVSGFRQYQLIQEASDRVVVLVVPAQGWTPEWLACFDITVREFFELPIELDVQVVERIELPASGKLLNIINKCAEPKA